MLRAYDGFKWDYVTNVTQMTAVVEAHRPLKSRRTAILGRSGVALLAQLPLVDGSSNATCVISRTLDRCSGWRADCPGDFSWRDEARRSSSCAAPCTASGQRQWVTSDDLRANTDRSSLPAVRFRKETQPFAALSIRRQQIGQMRA
jgi:hypothetical protein